MTNKEFIDKLIEMRNRIGWGTDLHELDLFVEECAERLEVELDASKLPMNFDVDSNGECTPFEVDTNGKRI